jgi:hypothetical protein
VATEKFVSAPFEAIFRTIERVVAFARFARILGGYRSSPDPKSSSARKGQHFAIKYTNRNIYLPRRRNATSYANGICKDATGNIAKYTRAFRRKATYIFFIVPVWNDELIAIHRSRQRIVAAVRAINTAEYI